MTNEKQFLVDVGMQHLPFPMSVASRENPNGQHTIAQISINARIMQEFEARWIDRFIQILHSHRDRIGTSSLRANILDYCRGLEASPVRVEFEYPFFMEKHTPVSNEPCLVRYQCKYSAKVTSVHETAKIRFAIDVPCITTYPASVSDVAGGLFGQLSVVRIEVETKEDMFPEDLVELVDKHALAPVYSFLTPDDQAHIIQKVHSEKKSSVVTTDHIKGELARNRGVEWYAVRCSNFGILHSYSTFVGTEKSIWVPFSGYEEDSV